MRLLIYGAGAMGQALGGVLAADGHRVELVLRERFCRVIATSGLRVSGIFGEYRVRPEQLGLLTEMVDTDGSGYDAILLTTKSYDTATSVEAIAGLRSCRCPVVSLQNGCGNLEQLEARFGRERSFAGRVITGFEIEEPGWVRITVTADAIHLGGSIPGTTDRRVEELAKAVAVAGIPCVAVADIRQSLHAKLLYNCALNPLGAVLGVRYGDLADSHDSRRIMDRVIEETFAVIRALGGNLPWVDAAAYQHVFYGCLVAATADHRSSMLQDIEQGKPTEVEAMVGYVSARGRAVGVATPCCDLLTSMVHFKEGKRGTVR